MNVRRLFDGSVAYYNETHAARDGSILPRQFPKSTPLTPGNPTEFMCKNGKSVKYVPEVNTWNHLTWRELNFAVDEPFYYAYQYISSGTGADAKFTVRAVGDLDCDGVLSTFERAGQADDKGFVSGGAGLYVNQETE